jgi:uncharacterized cupredoxin-like copper-binding protein
MNRPRILWPSLRPLRWAGWATLALVLSGLWAPDGAAKGGYADLKPTPVVVMLGDKENHFKFYPDRLKFETGKLYKLLLDNASPIKHEIASDELSNAVFTVKTEVVSPEGVEIAEIVGSVHEIEIGPGTTVEWYFVPTQTVKEALFICDQPGHLAGGMKGLFTIE